MRFIKELVLNFEGVLHTLNVVLFKLVGIHNVDDVCHVRIIAFPPTTLPPH